MTYPRSKHRIIGREYILLTLPAKPRRIKNEGHEHIQYVIYIPKKLAALLEKMNKPNEDAWRELDPADEGPHPIPLTLLVTPSPWHHLIDWNQMSRNAWEGLPDHIKKELEALGLDPEDGERILIPASPEELEELGLDPDRPITLRDVIEAVKKKFPATPSGRDDRKA